MKPDQRVWGAAGSGRPSALGVVVAVVTLALVVPGCGRKPSAPPSHRLEGVYIVHGFFSYRSYGEPCSPAEAGYPDIRPGTGVTVRDAAGAVLGTAALRGGRLRQGKLRGKIGAYTMFGGD